MHIKALWAQSKLFRVVLIAALVYTLARLAVHAIYLVTLMSSGEGVGAEMPEWAGTSGTTIPNDLNDYLTGARRLQNRQDLYIKGKLDRVEFYQYAPSYALAFVPFLFMSPLVLVLVHTALRFVAYVALYGLWGRILDRFKLAQAGRMLAWTLPLWLVFSAFWGDLGYLNIYIIMALLGTLLIDAVLNERLGWAVLWLSIILQIKPQWAFAAAVPLLLGRYRFFFKLIAAAVLAYIAVAGVTMLVVGPAYGWQQYVGYVRFLADMPANFPWRTPDAPFLGYNHSIKQIVLYLLGVTPRAMQLATAVKALLLLPLAATGVRYLLKPARCAGRDVPLLGLDWAFVLYLGAFVWLDMVWELSLGVAVLVYLLGTLQQRWKKALAWAVFLPYALVDLIQVISFAVWGMDAVLPGLYVWTDPSIYVPVIMIAILVFYVLLLGRLWQGAYRPVAEAESAA